MATAANHYETLGLWRDASDAEIRRAYRRLAMLYHPDVNSDLEAGKRFRAIKEAYDVLSEPNARARFDATLGAGPPTSSHPNSDRGSGVPSGWTPPWVHDWNAEAWLRANAAPPPWSLRAIANELSGSWQTLTGYLGALALVIGVCALLNWAIPWLGVAVVAAVFTLPPVAYLYLIVRGLKEEQKPTLFSQLRYRHDLRADASTSKGEQSGDGR
ncbi:MAG: J domain-containing protein [Gaiellaceae bacterium]